jgi:hypothetical protein
MGGKGFPSKWTHKQAGVATLLSDKVDVRLKSVIRDNEVHFILIKITIHQEEISILNIYAPSTVANIYTKKNFNEPNFRNKP